MNAPSGVFQRSCRQWGSVRAPRCPLLAPEGSRCFQGVRRPTLWAGGFKDRQTFLEDFLLWSCQEGERAAGQTLQNFPFRSVLLRMIPPNLPLYLPSCHHLQPRCAPTDPLAQEQGSNTLQSNRLRHNTSTASASQSHKVFQNCDYDSHCISLKIIPL